MPRKPSQSKSDSKKPRTGRGGKRAGAGRKTKEATKLREDFNAATNQTLIGWLPDLLKNLKKLADGGFERVEEKFEADPVVPGLMVLVERKREVAEPDRAANEYLVNRLLGRPKQAVEHSGPDGAPMAFESVVAKFYGARSSADDESNPA